MRIYKILRGRSRILRIVSQFENNLQDNGADKVPCARSSYRKAGLICIDDGDYGAYRMLNNQTGERNKFYLTRRSAKLGRRRIK